MLIEELSEGNLNFPPVTIWTKKIVSEWRPLLVFASTVRSNSIYKRPVLIARPGDVDSSVSRVKWLTALPVQGSLYSAGPCINWQPFMDNIYGQLSVYDWVERASTLPVWQWTPPYPIPSWQLQTYPLTWSTHVPPFKQGLLEHSLISICEISVLMRHWVVFTAFMITRLKLFAKYTAVLVRVVNQSKSFQLLSQVCFQVTNKPRKKNI